MRFGIPPHSPVVTLRLNWDNPFVGSNSFSASAEPEGQTEGRGSRLAFLAVVVTTRR